MFEYIVIFLLVYIVCMVTYIAVKDNKEENKKEEEEEEEYIPLKSFKEMEDDLKIMSTQLDILSKNVDFFMKKEMSRLWKWEE